MARTRAKSVAGSSREWPLWSCSVACWCRGSDTWQRWLFSGKSMEGFQVGGWTVSKKKGGVETVLVLLVFFWWKLLLHPISHETNVEINPQQRAKVVQYVFKGQASDIQLGDQKVNLNHLVDRPPFWCLCCNWAGVWFASSQKSQQRRKRKRDWTVSASNLVPVPIKIWIPNRPLSGHVYRTEICQDIWFQYTSW